MRTTIAALLCLAAGVAAAKEQPWPREDEAKKPREAERACAFLGEGYVRAPGSDTCVKVGGHVRFDSSVIWNR